MTRKRSQEKHGHRSGARQAQAAAPATGDALEIMQPAGAYALLAAYESRSLEHDPGVPEQPEWQPLERCEQRQRLEAAQVRLAGVAKQQNNLLESLARNELEQQKERIGTYQIQARFALAAIYDRAALGGGAVTTPSEGATESQGDLELVPEAAPTETPPAEAPK